MDRQAPASLLWWLRRRRTLGWGADDRLRAASAAQLPLVQREGRRRILAHMGASLAAATLAAILAEGQALTPEQALARAEHALTPPNAS